MLDSWKSMAHLSSKGLDINSFYIKTPYKAQIYTELYRNFVSERKESNIILNTFYDIITIIRMNI